jgi:hypothetical protein
MYCYSQIQTDCHQRIGAISIGGLIYVIEASTLIKNVRCLNLKFGAAISCDSFGAIEEQVIAD